MATRELSRQIIDMRRLCLVAFLLASACSSEFGSLDKDSLPASPHDPGAPGPIETPPGQTPQPVACAAGDARLEANGTCYALLNTPATWGQARANCQALGGDLAVVTSAAEQALLEPLVAQAAGPKVWLGLSDQLIEGVFVWTDGTLVSLADGTVLGYENAASGQPDGGTAQNCVAFDLTRDTQWDDRACAEVNAALCELP